MSGTATVYDWLMDGDGSGEHFDRHVFACVIAVVRGGPAQPPAGGSLTHGLGLSPDALRVLVDRYFPARRAALLAGAEAAGWDDDELEEADLRGLLLTHRAWQREEEAWLAAIVARRALAPNHLWQDLGLRDRGELNRLLARAFPGLHALNSGNMKWKKFFYRLLCQTEGVVVCKSPHCEVCTDFALCFGEESGEPLLFQQPPFAQAAE